MDKFIIYFINAMVRVESFEEDEIIVLKKEGEEEFEYNKEFWNWFKEKIEYDGRELSFIVVSNMNFSIPEDIKIAKKSKFDKNIYVKKYKNSKVFEYPVIDKTAIKKVKVSNKKLLSDYFREKKMGLL